MSRSKVDSAIILAGGLGLRLRPLTNTNPKVMIKIRGRPISEWQVNWLRRYGVKRIVFAGGYKWKKIKEHFKDGRRFGVSAEYCVEDEPLGTGGALKKALQMVDYVDTIVTNGDVLTDLDLHDMVQWHRRLDAKATILVVPFISPYGIIEASIKGKVKRFVEKPVIPNTYINGGVYVVSKALQSSLPDKGGIETSTFPRLAQQDQLAAYPYEGFWRTVDTLKDLLSLETELGRAQRSGRTIT